ncbi:hypothetical protein OEZ85_003448 [Tetradesmus obliquus]|uniref:Cyclin N-terminal domain-containing protein n=1 Tax=Tetradesmus obliquus TaxID=3088 RepID=A0ABY8UBC9_TETOB|nr:hypothetical protein OEZ85_003448 [Tetradesmus obliquus]
MDQPFGFEAAKENYLAMHSGVPSKASSQTTRQAFGNISNSGCFVDLPKENFLVYDDSCCGKREQVASTSSRAPLAERQATTQSQRSTGVVSKAAPAPTAAPAPKRQQQQSWVDIDEQNKDNPLACSEYAENIFDYLNTCELLNRPNPKYLEAIQSDMSPHMRCILVDWLVEVAQEYRLTSDTLHLSLNLLDRFLSLQAVAREELQLAGIACMWAASKFEEIYAPTARNFCYITDNTYDQQQLVAMEARLLAVLDFQLAVPTAKTFQRRYLQAAAADEQLHYLAAFLLELTLMDEGLMAYLPSQLAAGSVYLANAMLGRKPWDATLSHYSRYKDFEVQACAAELAITHARILSEGQFSAIREKYSSDKLLNVAGVPCCQQLLQAGLAALDRQQRQAAQQQQRGGVLQVAPDSPQASYSGSGELASSDMELL